MAAKRFIALIFSLFLLVSAIPVFAATAAPAKGSGESTSKAASDDGAEEEPAHLEKNLVILFTSDVHCGFDQNFGLAGLTKLREYYEAQDNHVLLVDNGDFIQGEAIGTMTSGEVPIDLMNVAGYDIAIPGNHEFDYGMEQFLALAEKTDFPYISCNFNKDGELIFEPYVIREFDGVKIAFIGITTPKTLSTSMPRYFQDEDGNFLYGFFQDEDGSLLYEKVQEAVDAAREEGAAYCIALAHLGNEEKSSPYRYDEVIAATTGIDVLLDGHSHDTDQVIMKNKDGEEVLRSACGTKLANVGTITIDTEGNITNDLLTWDLPATASSIFPIHTRMTRAIKSATEELNKSLEEVVGETAFDLTIVDPKEKDAQGNPIRIVRRAETNLADLCADALRAEGEADIAIINGGGVRVSIPAGKITKRDILSVHPFGNMLTVVEATGQQILDALEWGTRAVPTELGGFPQVSGLTYEIHTYIEDGCTSDDEGFWTGHEGDYRVQNVMVDGKPLDLDKTYTVASQNYILLERGDGYAMFDGCEVLQESVMLDNQVLMNYITEKLDGVIGEEYEDPYGEGRIIAVEEAPKKVGAKDKK
ncbi:MAG: bifunctional metallophosphatase/5'-nucleotidase [Lachnospiraceae bacterium]|nr:bifunctional metallophosphatase/5'-nucleotidase [Lachnospiraceae bacterium]